MLAEIFLNSEGLEFIAKMLERLPSGHLPNPTFRKGIYSILIDLPIMNDHLMQTSIGKTLTTIEKSGEEMESNLKIIREIKEKWSRIVFKSKVEYKNEDSERYLQERKKATQKFVPHHVKDSGKISTNYQGIDASQVRKMKRRYDFLLAPSNNVEVEKHDNIKVS